MEKWSSKIYRMLSLWLSQISINRQMHQKKSVSLSKLNEVFTVVLIIMSGAASVSSFINMADFSPRIKLGINLSVGIISLLNCILAGICNKMKFEENSLLHKSISNEYSDLSNYIQMSILLPNKPPINELVKIVTDRIEIINRYGPPLVDNQHSIADLPNFILAKDEKIDLHDSDIKLFLSPSNSSSIEKPNLDDSIEME